MKILKEKRIEHNELDEIAEQRNRIFRVSFVEHTGTRRLQKYFQKKEYVKQCIKNPKIHSIKIYYGDVIEQK